MDFHGHWEIIKKLKRQIGSPPSYDILNILLSELQYTMQDNPDLPIEDRDFIMAYSCLIKKWAVTRYVQTMDTRWDDLYWKTLHFESPYLFESYLIYLEKNREAKDRFYLPKCRQLNKHGLIQAMQDLEDDRLDILSISMPPGTQKPQPLYSKVLTPEGFIRMGDIRVGTKVISGTGNVCNVTGVYPQGVKPIYELTFDDGSKCRCSDEHLWTVQTRDDRKRKNKDGSEKYRTISLNEIGHFIVRLGG